MSNYKKKEVMDYLTRKPLSEQDLQMAYEAGQQTLDSIPETPVASNEERVLNRQPFYQNPPQLFEDDSVNPQVDGIPLYQGVKPGVAIEERMPIYLPPDMAPVMPQVPGIPDPQYKQLELATGGRVGFQEGGTYPTSAIAPSGIEYELFYSPFSGKPLYRPKYDPSRTDLVYSGTDPEEFFKTVMSTGTSTPTTTEIPTVDPFSGQQVSAQEQEAFANTSGINFQSTSPVEPEITNPILTQPQLPVSNNPALTNLGAFFGINDPIKDFSQFKPETQKILSDTIMRSLPFSNNPNNLDIDYKKYGTEGAPVFQGGYSNILDQAKAGLNALMGDPAEQLRMAYGRFNVNIDPATQTAYMKDTYDFNQGGENNLLNKIGTPYKVNIALPKELTQNIINSPYYQNALAQSSPDQFKNLRAQGSQQEAAARVSPMVAGITPMMAYGGRVSMSDGGLTTTIAPAKGPDSQGVESLFRRRYN